MSWLSSAEERYRSSATLRLMVVLLFFTTALNVLLPIFVPAAPVASSPAAVIHADSPRRYRNYMGNDFPHELEVPDAFKHVALTVEDSINFQLDTFEGEAQWNAILPPGGGYVTLGPPRYNHGGHPKRFRVSMFHGLSCLDTIRRSVMARHKDKSIPAGEDARYCLNYIRQMILCRSDIQLEWVRSEYGGKSVQPFVTHENCRDWTTVYREVEKLQEEAAARNFSTWAV